MDDRFRTESVIGMDQNMQRERNVISHPGARRKQLATIRLALRVALRARCIFRRDQRSMDRKALEPFLGGRSRVSEVLNRKWSLSMTQIRKLHEGLNIPFENLMGTM